MFSHKPDMSSVDLSEDAIVDFVHETCTRSAFLLNAICECNMDKVKSIIVESLENWFVAANTFSKLPGPMSLVKQWVKVATKKYHAQDTVSSLYSFLLIYVFLLSHLCSISQIECKTHKNVDAQDTASSLYSFLSRSEKVSKRTTGIILEQVRVIFLFNQISGNCSHLIIVSLCGVQSQGLLFLHECSYLREQ